MSCCSDDEEENPASPVFEYPPQSYLAERIITILLDPNIDTRKICRQRSLEVLRML